MSTESALVGIRRGGDFQFGNTPLQTALVTGIIVFVTMGIFSFFFNGKTIIETLTIAIGLGILSIIIVYLIQLLNRKFKSKP